MFAAGAALVLATLLEPAAYQNPPDHAEAVSLATTSAPPAIDARLEDEAWKAAARIELTRQTEPGDNTPASERTNAWLTTDDKYLYLAVHAWDTDAAAVRARVVRRDEVSADDHIILTLDTDDARQRAYRFFINPFGIQADAIYTVAGNDDFSWDGLFDSRGRVTEDGYIVEARIPFKSLRFRSGPGTRWGLHLQRWIARKGERTSWRALSRDNASYLGQMGTMTGLDQAKGGRAIDLVPTVVTAVGELSPGAGQPLARDNRSEVGLTGLYALTSNLTLSGTVNPDFSQVEADAPQITVNQRFAISFPEKRPFFLEGAEFLASGVPGAFRLLDTRTIVNPDWGAKLTGRTGRQAIGVLSANDDLPVADDAMVFATKYQRDLFTDAAVGGIVVNRHQGNRRNTVVSGEARFRVKRVTTTGVQLAQSTTETGAQSTTGQAYRVMWTTYARTWKIFLWDQAVSRDFRADAGFLTRTGYHQSFVDVGYEWRPKTPTWWTSFWPYILTTRSVDAQGELEFEYADPAVQIDFARNVRVNYYWSFDHDRFAGRDLYYNFHSASVNVSRFKRLTFFSGVRVGDGARYDPRNPQVGRFLRLDQNATARVTEQLLIGLQYLSSTLTEHETGVSLSSQHLTRLRVQWQARPSVGVRVISDYDSAARRLGWSVLYAYTPRPLTAIYVGYNDLQTDLVEGGWMRQQRTLFLKASYGWRP